jgi:superfamily I DNA/RNA helicase
MTTQKAKSAAIAEYREITALSDIVRSTLTGDISSSQKAGHRIVTPDEVAQTAAMYSINYQKQSSLEQACEVVKAGSKNLSIVDFTDMIAQPACHDLAPDKVDLGLVDEAQDMNTAQQWLATRSADRLAIVGDDNQSIFGWAGADPESMLRLYNQLGETHRGVITLPLTETRRCAKSIVAVAQQFVPQFRAHASNIEGLVTDCKASDLVDILGKDSSEKVDVAVLCRTNAPLARLGLQLLRAEIPVAVKSGNFAKTIKSIVKKLDCGNITEFRNNLDTYLQIELDKIAKWKSPNADQVRSLIEDRCDTILVLSEGCSTVACISQKIDRLFDDTPDRRKIPLSSVHSAKGLEWDKVIIHKPDLLPHPKISEKNAFNAAQERNLAYVGFTRAKRELIFARDSKEV